MLSKYKYLIDNLGFSHFAFWSGNVFLIAPFPDHCRLVRFSDAVGQILYRIAVLFIEATQHMIYHPGVSTKADNLE